MVATMVEIATAKVRAKSSEANRLAMNNLRALVGTR